MKLSGPGADWREIDRFESEDGTDAGVGWIAHPEEAMQRASHALSVDGEVYVVDPVDAAGIDEVLADLGEVAGVVVLLDRHTRDAAEIASRHDVPVYVPSLLSEVGSDLDVPVERIGRELGDTGYVVREVLDNALWKEAALFGEHNGVLLVPEALGTADFFLARGERLGVHPALRMTPPRRLARLEPQRVLVGHGAGIDTNAAGVLEEAVSRSRIRTPGLYLKTLRSFLPV